VETAMKNKALDDIRLKKCRTIPVPGFNRFPELLGGFTTRYGGVSTGAYASLNLNFNRSDAPEIVMENYRLLGEELGVALDSMVLSHQVHDNRVMPITREHAGMGLVRERSYTRVDGLCTQEKGLMLVTHYADCVPLYFYDPDKQVIALSHSGWKGTLLDIGGETLRVLEETYACKPEHIHVAFGPHIRSCCFEVDEDVARPFREKYPWAEDYSRRREDGKWLLDLEAIITQALVARRVPREQIYGNKACTRCHHDIFFSHRGSGGHTGTGAAYLMMRG